MQGKHYLYSGLFFVVIGMSMIITIMFYQFQILKNSDLTYLFAFLFDPTYFGEFSSDPTLTWRLMMNWTGIIMVVIGTIIVLSNVKITRHWK
jgi:hypothetical protein